MRFMFHVKEKNRLSFAAAYGFILNSCNFQDDHYFVEFPAIYFT